MKRAKSKQLFAYLVLDKNESRDRSISELLDQEHKPLLTKDSLFVSDVYRSIEKNKNLSRAKTWKTQSGAERFHTKISKVIKPDETVMLVDITEKWNVEVDQRIDMENKDHENRVNKLLKLKI